MSKLVLFTAPSGAGKTTIVRHILSKYDEVDFSTSEISFYFLIIIFLENKIVSFDARLISATNQPLEEMSINGSFRQDLLYRINTVEIELPPLRERGSDIEILARHFLRIFSEKYQKSGKRINSEAMATLCKYHWPGNIRELQHAIERAVIMSDSSELSIEDFLFPL